MKVFVYAYVSFFDNNPMLKTVLASDVMDALKKIFLECCPETEGYDSNDQMEDLMMLQTPEDFVQYFSDADLGISIPVALESLVGEEK